MSAMWNKCDGIGLEPNRLATYTTVVSGDDKNYTLMRNAWMEANRPVKIGMMGACPDGDGFNARFSNFSVKHLPDKVRTEWLKANAE